MDRHYAGEFVSSLEDLWVKKIPLHYPRNMRNNSDAGTVEFKQVHVVEKPNFMEFLRSGWGISMTAAIDFTASNGDPNNPHSLHYIGAFNQYEAATQAVGSILENYDYDKSFPVYGFGGVPGHMGSPQVNHCFPLNGNPANPEIQGV